MTAFDQRLKAFEHSYAHDAEMQFRIEARANKLLGLWAAGVLDKTPLEAHHYANDVVRSDFAEPGDADVIRKVARDLGRHSTAEEVRSMRSAYIEAAKAQIAAGN
ncbi:DUF1476 domain-containing protein [Aliiruegeria sabulilitoris]|uniref:DUF1476 domain-containing protein n=1 Tax=Aliiruegeria sabulilitoris TaxID=1510458 RepID=UPI00083180D2|nr:DUF1476 domain-containing protein [Aliiruegeria sabulilitoris]NDR59627.1 DUF1476 domain-containing protein [Pseudoruegeria sp. M32A2M]